MVAEPERLSIGGKACQVIWRPQAGPQKKLLSCPHFEVLYGGARGGGKTDAMLGEWIQHAQTYGRHAIGRMFRRERTQLMETIARAQELFIPLGAKWREVEKTFVFPNGARLGFAYLERDADAEVYQGASFTRVYIEEIGNFPDPKPVKKLMATLRSAHGVPCRFRCTANPGGPGHQHVKARYIDPAPKGYQVITDPDTGLQRVYIPAKIIDNPALLNNDPTYVARLRSVGSDQLVRAWLEGDWDIVEGAFFDNWNASQHVIRPVALPEHWTRFRALDWGSARPFSVGWYAVSDGSLAAFPSRAIIHYREWYGMRDNQPNTGLKLDVEAVAAGILERDGHDDISYGIADPSVFQQDGGPSIAERFARQGVLWRRGDNKRIPGWQQVRARLTGEDGKPMLYVFSSCPHLIRTLPALQHDEHHIEDVDTDGEDHCLTAETIIATPSGVKRLGEMPEAGEVMTAEGVRPYRSARLTRRMASLVELTFSDSTTVRCTPDHRFWTAQGWREARDLVDAICYVGISNKRGATWHWSWWSARPSKSSTASGITDAVGTSSARGAASMWRFGSITMARFCQAMSYITGIWTAPIISLSICSASQSATMAEFTGLKAARELGLTYCVRERLRPSGMVVKTAWLGIEPIMRPIAEARSTRRSSIVANSAAVPFWASKWHVFARTTAGLRGAGRPDKTSPRLRASSAVNRLGQIVIDRTRLALSAAVANCRPRRAVVCRGLREAGQGDVYCLTVPSTGHFMLGNGLIVSNCGDELRYACMSRPYAAPVHEDEPTRWPHEMTMDELVARRLEHSSEGVRV